MFSAV